MSTGLTPSWGRTNTVVSRSTVGKLVKSYWIRVEFRILPFKLCAILRHESGKDFSGGMQGDGSAFSNPRHVVDMANQRLVHFHQG